MSVAMSPRKRRSRLQIGPGSAGISLAPEEFDAITEFEEGYRYELIRGVLVVSPPPGISERDPNDDLGHILRMYQENHPRGSALDKTVPEQTIAATANRRRADRVVWTGLGRLPEEGVDIPSIVIEFVSESRRDIRRDYKEKRDEYLAAGVREYWIIDRFQRKMTIYRKSGDKVVEETIPEKANYETDLLPGFSLPLARLLGTADSWPQAKRKRKPPARGSH